MTGSFSWRLALPAHTEKFRKLLKSLREVDTSEPLSGEMVTLYNTPPAFVKRAH